MALNQSSCHACQMSIVCTIKGPQREAGVGGRMVWKRIYNEKESPLKQLTEC